SRILDWNDRGTCVLFGDGAGAVVLASSEKPGIHASRLHADGGQVGMLSVPGDVLRGRIVGSPFLQMNGQGVFKFAVRILEATARKLEMPREKLVVTVDHHGNTSAASVPLALDEFVRKGAIRPGD